MFKNTRHLSDSPFFLPAHTYGNVWQICVLYHACSEHPSCDRWATKFGTSVAKVMKCVQQWYLARKDLLDLAGHPQFGRSGICISKVCMFDQFDPLLCYLSTFQELVIPIQNAASWTKAEICFTSGTCWVEYNLPTGAPVFVFALVDIESPCRLADTWF